MRDHLCDPITSILWYFKSFLFTCKKNPLVFLPGHFQSTSCQALLPAPPEHCSHGCASSYEPPSSPSRCSSLSSCITHLLPWITDMVPLLSSNATFLAFFPLETSFGSLDWNVCGSGLLGYSCTGSCQEGCFFPVFQPCACMQLCLSSPPSTILLAHYHVWRSSIHWNLSSRQAFLLFLKFCYLLIAFHTTTAVVHRCTGQTDFQFAHAPIAWENNKRFFPPTFSCRFQTLYSEIRQQLGKMGHYGRVLAG